MATQGNPRSPSDYSVGWICALECELRAAQAALDEQHPRLPTSAGDNNVYTLGDIRLGHRSHNVVIVSLPIGNYGTASAAVACTHLTRTFPNLKFGLMVGIGGAAPKITNDPRTTLDIRLGDVVVGVPGPNRPAIFQYDLGKSHHGDRWLHPSQFLNGPSRTLLNAVTSLKSRYSSEPRSILDLVESLKNHANLRSELQRQHESPDVLFEPSYPHMDSEPTCECCDRNRILQRPERFDEFPRAFYGTIGSGNQVIRDPVTRDYWRDKAGVLCFEMESAGIVNDLPCLVIRGICDYSDSHKNKTWQFYAAVAAAAYAKHLLLQVEPHDYHHSTYSRAIESDGESYSDDTWFKGLLATFWFRDIDQRYEGVEDAHSETFKWLFHYDQSQAATLADQCSNTYSFERDGTLAYQYSYEYQTELLKGNSNLDWDPCGLLSWLRDDRGLYFISGKPGCGKSTLMKYISKEPLFRLKLQQWARSNYLCTPCVFFWRAGSKMQNTQHFMLQSILYQIFKELPELMSKVLEPHEAESAINRPRAEDGISVWNTHELQSFLKRTTSIHNLRICLLIDGLDEFDGNPSDIADFLLKLSLGDNLKVLVAGRLLVEYSRIFRGYTNMKLHEWTRHDIEAYANGLLLENEYVHEIVLPFQVEFESLVNELRDRSEGLFIWVKTAVSLITEGIDYGDTVDELQIRLRQLPQDLFDLYEDMFLRINKGYLEQAKSLIAVILVLLDTSRGDISVLLVALASEFLKSDGNYLIRYRNLREEEELQLLRIYTQRIRSQCQGFMSVGDNRREPVIQIMHRTVSDFFATSKMQNWLYGTDAAREHAELGARFGSLAYHIQDFLSSWMTDTLLGDILNNSSIFGYFQDALASNPLSTNTDALLNLEKVMAQWLKQDQNISFAIDKVVGYLEADSLLRRQTAMMNLETYYQFQVFSKYYESQPMLALSCAWNHKNFPLLESVFRIQQDTISAEMTTDLLTYCLVHSIYLRAISWPEYIDAIPCWAPEDLMIDLLRSNPGQIHMLWPRFFQILFRVLPRPEQNDFKPGLGRLIPYLEFFLEKGTDPNQAIQLHVPEQTNLGPCSPLHILKLLEEQIQYYGDSDFNEERELVQSYGGKDFCAQEIAPEKLTWDLADVCDPWDGTSPLDEEMQRTRLFEIIRSRALSLKQRVKPA